MSLHQCLLQKYLEDLQTDFPLYYYVNVLLFEKKTNLYIQYIREKNMFKAKKRDVDLAAFIFFIYVYGSTVYTLLVLFSCSAKGRFLLVELFLNVSENLKDIVVQKSSAPLGFFFFPVNDPDRHTGLQSVQTSHSPPSSVCLICLYFHMV